MNNSNTIGLTKNNIDWITILLYVVLVFFGWVSIYAAVYNDDHRSVFDITQRYGMQLVWIGISFLVAMVIVLTDQKYYHIFSYPFYWFMLLMMVGTLFLGREVNGARSWFDIAGVRIQPVEFMKLATALALARFMSSYHFDIRKSKSLYYIGLIIGVPVVFILMQNDTGSALVSAAFLIMLYREGFGKIIYILSGLFVILVISTFLLEDDIVLLLIVLATLIGFVITNRRWDIAIRYLALLLLLAALIWWGALIVGYKLNLYYSLLGAILLTLPIAARANYTMRLKQVGTLIIIASMALAFTFVVDYAFENVLQAHQKNRILDLLGIVKDTKGFSYNVIQSKIAIGSGGFWGKGFLEGTQTKFSFVPEQSTDFIFCTVGEEWGFVGSAIVVTLFTILIIRLMKMGERQHEPFARIYCYSVASIFFVHFLINIAMTIGLFPVVGIPLPFFSYGGSSLLAFTILLFIAIRLDSSQV
ncbi:MAG: rod shape-determining protein RodA [Mucinivorans sp.]